MEKITEVLNRTLIKKVDELSEMNEYQKFVIDMLQEEISELTRMVLEDYDLIIPN